MDDYLFTFFMKNSIHIEIFVSAGLNIRKIGESKMALKELIDRNTDVDDHISAILSSTMIIIGVNNTPIGKVEY